MILMILSQNTVLSAVAVSYRMTAGRLIHAQHEHNMNTTSSTLDYCTCVMMTLLALLVLSTNLIHTAGSAPGHVDGILRVLISSTMWCCGNYQRQRGNKDTRNKTHTSSSVYCKVLQLLSIFNKCLNFRIMKTFQPEM